MGPASHHPAPSAPRHPNLPRRSMPMRTFTSLIKPAGRSLAGHLGRLRDALDGLGGRLREAIAHAVARSPAGAVREAIQALLSELPEGPPHPPAYHPHRWQGPSPGPARPLWGHQEQDPGRGFEDDPRSPWGDDREDEGWPEEDFDDAPPPAPTRLPLDSTPRWCARLAGVAKAAWHTTAGAVKYVATKTAGAVVNCVGAARTRVVSTYSPG